MPVRWAAAIALALAASLLLAACGGGGAGAPASPVTTATVRAVRTIRFDRSALTVAADRDVEITFVNEDTGIAHNLAIYRDSAFREKLYGTEIREAPHQATLTVRLAPGRYYFRCDVHPAQMRGTLVAR
ncbi:MAG TPA: cupredoxin domain-containing protein [Dehalococcoidia bacterium]|nr:cupredoxin domain-containing protein [Dehalococcoidia bacterium]